MKGFSLFQSPPAPDVGATDGATTLRQRLTVPDIRKKRRSGSCDNNPSGSPFLKPETERAPKRSFFRRVDPNIANVTRRLARLSPQVVEALAVRIGLEPRPDAVWEFIGDNNNSQCQEFVRLVQALDEIAPEQVAMSPEQASVPPPPQAPVPVPMGRVPRLGPISSYPFVDARYSYNAREDAICADAIPLGMSEYDHIFEVPDLGVGERAVIQCFTVGIVPAIVSWPRSCKIYVNDVLVKAPGLCNFLLIDLTEFGSRPRVRVLCGVEQNRYALLLRVATFRSYGELVNVIKMGRQNMTPLSGAVEPIVIDPISGRLMENPGRGVNCRHDQCFDLKAYLKKANHTRVWACPLCNMSATMDELIFHDPTAQLIFNARMRQEVVPEPAPEVEDDGEFDVSVITDGGCFTEAWNDVY